MEKEKIKVLIVDDSALMRSLISKIIETQDDMTVVGKAMNGVFALQKIPSLKPDIIILDLEMPEMNGIDFLKEKTKQGIKIPVIILSSIAKKGAGVTFEALSTGASDFITKPDGHKADISYVSDQLCSMVRGYVLKNAAAAVKQTLKKEDLAEGNKPVQIKKDSLKELKTKEEKIEIVAIGISTGGPNALRYFFSNLDSSFKTPIVIVQHMPEGFTVEFAKSLNKLTHMEVKEAENGDLLKQGRVLIAPGNRHVKVEKKRLGAVISLDNSGNVNGHTPSAGVLFNSVAEQYGGNAMGIIMTGMGKDGSLEIGKIKDAGGITIAQDMESSVVFGMPKVAIENNNIDKIVSLDDMAETVSTIISRNNS